MFWYDYIINAFRSHRQYLDSLFPDVTVDDVLSNMSFEVKIPANVKIVEPPTEEVEIIRTLDPKGIKKLNN